MQFRILPFFFLVISVVFAQEKRVAVPVDPKSEQVLVKCNASTCFLIKKNNQLGKVEIIALADSLSELWGIRFLPELTNLQIAQAKDDKLILFFSDLQQVRFQLVEIDSETGHYISSFYSINRPFYPRRLINYRDQYWISGQVNGEPIAFFLDTKVGGFKTLPIGLAGSLDAIADLNFNAKTKLLDLLLKTSEGKHQLFVLRSLDINGKVKANLTLTLPKGAKVKESKLAYPDRTGEKWVISTVTKSNPEMIHGLHVFRANGTKVLSSATQLFDEIPQLAMQFDLSLDDSIFVERKGRLRQADGILGEMKFSKENKLMVAFEILETDYEVRGYLQREADMQALNNQLDLNQFGRRDFQNEEGGGESGFSTLQDRAETFSGTDAVTYSYQEALVDRVQVSGKRHSKSVLIKIGDNGVESARYIRLPGKINSVFSISDENLFWRNESFHYWWQSADAGYVCSFRQPDQMTNFKRVGTQLSPNTRVQGSALINYTTILSEGSTFLLIRKFWLND